VYSSVPVQVWSLPLLPWLSQAPAATSSGVGFLVPLLFLSPHAASASAIEQPATNNQFKRVTLSILTIS
jgi:hypothetical protein